MAVLLSISSCKLVDLRTDHLKESHSDNETKGRSLLEESVRAMGYNKLAELETYEVETKFKWKFPWSIMPMNSFPGTGRSGKRAEKLRFIAGNFDGLCFFGLLELEVKYHMFSSVTLL